MNVLAIILLINITAYSTPSYTHIDFQLSKPCNGTVILTYNGSSYFMGNINGTFFQGEINKTLIGEANLSVTCGKTLTYPINITYLPIGNVNYTSQFFPTIIEETKEKETEINLLPAISIIVFFIFILLIKELITKD